MDVLDELVNMNLEVEPVIKDTQKKSNPAPPPAKESVVNSSVLDRMIDSFSGCT